jgi:hypothetical protein
MVVLDGNIAVGCGPGIVFPSIHIFQCILERTDAITNEVLEPFTFFLAYPTIFSYTIVGFISIGNLSFFLTFRRKM